MSPGGPAAAARCVGAILAGGRSSRFGGPKGLAAIGGVRLVDRAAAALREAADDLLLVANPPDAADWLPGVACAADRIVGAGALGGIHAALAEAHAPVLVLAWDMPWPSASLLRALREAGERAGPGCFGVVPDGPHGPEPLCAWYAPAMRVGIEAMLARGERRAQAIADVPGVIRVDAGTVARYGDPARLFANVNTLADLERASRDVPD